MLCLSDHEDLNRPQLSQIDIQVEVLEDAPNGRLQVRIHLLVFQACNVNAADSRQIDLTVTVYDDASLEVDLPPCADEQFIPRPYNIVCRDRNTIDGRKRAWHIIEEIASVYGKTLAARAINKFLKFRLLFAHRLLLCRRIGERKIEGFAAIARRFISTRSWN